MFLQIMYLYSKMHEMTVNFGKKKPHTHMNIHFNVKFESF